MELFNNKENELLKFKINSEGIDVNNIESRLILTTKENKNYFIIGEIENGTCKFNIPQLTLYEKGNYGKIKFEIISEDLCFHVWEDDFEIKTKSTIKIEEMISEIQKNSVTKPRISVSEAKIEAKPIVENKKIVDNKVEISNTLSRLESIFEKNNTPIIIEEDEEDENVEKDISTSPIIRFDSFK